MAKTLKMSITRSCGQVTLINLLIILVIMIVFFVFLPVIINYTNNYAIPAVATSTSDQPTKDLLNALIYLFPVVVVIMIIVSGLSYAIPRREQ